jgi:hypothetical protein
MTVLPACANCGTALNGPYCSNCGQKASDYHKPIWWIVGEAVIDLKQRFRKSIIQWLPYMLVLASFSIWRAFFFQSNTYQISAMESLTSTPQATIVDLLKTLGSNFVVGGWLAWNQIFTPPNALEFQILTTRLYWLVVVAMFVFTFVFMARVRFTPEVSDEETNQPQKWGWQAVLLGVLALLAGVCGSKASRRQRALWPAQVRSS